MGLEGDAEWLRREANRLFDRLNQVAKQIRATDVSEAQKAGYVALMASDLCQVLREILRRGLFQELAQGVTSDLRQGTVSIDAIRTDVRKIITFERRLLTGFQLSKGATNELLNSFQDSKLLRESPDFSELTFMQSVELAIEEVCSVPKTGTELWIQQTYKKARKRYGLVGGVAIAATNVAALSIGLDPTLGAVSKFVGAIITQDGSGPVDGV